MTVTTLGSMYDDQMAGSYSMEMSGSEACTQQVLEMINPQTGNRVTATDGCEIEELRQKGFVSLNEYENGQGGTPPQTAGGSALVVVGVLVAGGLLYSSL